MPIAFFMSTPDCKCFYAVKPISKFDKVIPVKRAHPVNFYASFCISSINFYCFTVWR